MRLLKNKTFLKFLPITIVLVAVLFRLPLLSGSFWLDEAAQALESSRPFSQQLNIAADFQPPLLHYLVHFALAAGKSEWCLRLIGALIPGLVSVYFTYKIGELLWSRRVGIVASLLLSTSSFHIFYSQELRPYSLPAGIATASWWVLLKVWKQKKLAMKDLVLFATLSALGLYASYLYPFLLISQAIFVLFYLRKNIWKWLGSFVAAGLAFMAILPIFLEQLSVGTSLRTELPGWESVVSFTQIKVLPLVFAKFVFGVSNVEVSLWFVGVVLVLLALVVLLFTNHKKAFFADSRLVLLIWLAVPIITAFLISYFVPVLQPKRVLFCLPAFYLFVASLANFKKSLTKDRFALSLVFIFLSVNIVSTAQYWTNPDLQRENWRALIAEIQTQYPSSTAVLFAFPKPFAPWTWYADSSYPAYTSNSILTDSNPDLADDIKKINQYDHVLLFEYLTELTDPNNKLQNILESYDYSDQGYLVYPNIGHVWIYSKPSAVISYTQP